MSVLVVGSVAYDSVTTMAGSRKDALGGSATYFSLAASYFAPVAIVAVVGHDFSSEYVDLLGDRHIDTSGLEFRPGETFRWQGIYGSEDVNSRETLSTRLNVFAEFSPLLSRSHRSASYLFLANIGPGLQKDVLEQMDSRPSLVALDTMNYWIERDKDLLKSAVQVADVLLVDEGEVRAFTGEVNLVRAANRIHEIGPGTVIIKRGEHGVLLFHKGSVFATPAYPLEEVIDPTGAGDAFAGGFMGYVAATGDTSADGFRRAAVLGSIMGSLAIESFSTDRLASLTRDEIDARFRAFTELCEFEPLRDEESLPWRLQQ